MKPSAVARSLQGQQPGPRVGGPSRAPALLGAAGDGDSDDGEEEGARHDVAMRLFGGASDDDDIDLEDEAWEGYDRPQPGGGRQGVVQALQLQLRRQGGRQWEMRGAGAGGLPSSLAIGARGGGAAHDAHGGGRGQPLALREDDLRRVAREELAGFLSMATDPGVNILRPGVFNHAQVGWSAAVELCAACRSSAASCDQALRAACLFSS